jgi:hypothetical protein
VNGFGPGNRPRLTAEFEVAFPGHSSGADVVLDDENRDGGGLIRSHGWSEDAVLGEYHVGRLLCKQRTGRRLPQRPSSAVDDILKNDKYLIP